MPKGYKFLEKHEARYKEEAFISVVDNAFGMDKSTLFKSIELDNKKIILGSNKNVHGRGLKQAAFYFGLSLEIFTNNLKESSEMKFDISKVESLNTPIKRSVKVSSYKKRGTKILIQKIYSNKLLKRKNIAILQEALLARY
jgi:ribosomal protein S24E